MATARAKAKATGNLVEVIKEPFFSDLQELAALRTAGKTPLPCKFALHILCIQSTQTSSERIFSRAAVVPRSLDEKHREVRTQLHQLQVADCCLSRPFLYA